MSNTRTKAAVLISTLGVSVLGALVAPAVASADPWQPYWSGPEYPLRHYVGDAEHPVWSFTHPLRALIP
jgi:hypothetical protein